MTDSSSHPEIKALERCLTSVAEACSRLADDNAALRLQVERLEARLRGLRR